jgi:glycosyltransferase involved in cell wall biosynthesis
MKILSILIPTVAQRPNVSLGLFWEILRQIGYDSNTVGRAARKVPERCNVGVSEFGNFEIIFCGDDKVMSIGQKRNILYREASAEYCWQIDDDDWIHPNAIELIINAIEVHNHPDCITFEEKCLMNGIEYKSNHSLNYDDWNGDGSALLADGFHFQRTPFYKDVIKNKIARNLPLEKIRYGEDHEWSRRLKPLLRNEGHIETQIYEYIHNSKPEEFQERYGMNL